MELNKKLSNNDSLKKVAAFIQQKFGDDFKRSIDNLQTQSVIRWPEIALRATIAILTLFLVQVFFNIYKYNQQQTSHLYSKAETLELYRNAEAEKVEMRKGMLSKMDPAPRFERGPTPPTEQIINVLDKVKG